MPLDRRDLSGPERSAVGYRVTSDHRVPMLALLGGLALGLPSCAIAQQAAATAVAAPHWTASVTAFEVHDSTGAAFRQPFLGGYDVPRPQLVDIDGDGDLDMFLQERSDQISYFEHTDQGLIWRTDQWQGVDVGEWYRFFDLDLDGDFDLLGELPNSYVRAWRNEGSRTDPRMVVVPDSLRDAAGKPIFADRQNILNIVDIDCNGRLDLFIGRVAGTIDRYEAEPTLGANGLLRFRFITGRWEGIEIIGIGARPGVLPTPAGSWHGANTMSFGDINGDGNIDLLWGDFFEQGLLLIENTDKCPSFSLRSTPRQFPIGNPVLTTGYNAPTIGDFDRDGRADVVLGVIGGAFNPTHSSIKNLYLITQPAQDSFEVVTPRLIPTVDVGSESMPSLGDLDGDGDLDLLVGNRVDPVEVNTATITLFENTGSATAPVFRFRGDIGIRGTFHYAPEITDLDGDGHPDLVVGTWNDEVEWWRNVGTSFNPKWEIADSALVVISRGSNTVPALADLDGDGDLDMLIGESSGEVNLYRNDGSATTPNFTLVTDNYSGMDIGRRSAPEFFDFDGDGKPDLLLGSEMGDVRLWWNRSEDGDIKFVMDSAFTMSTDHMVSPALGDLDGDGRAELITGTISGGLRGWKRDD